MGYPNGWCTPKEKTQPKNYSKKIKEQDSWLKREDSMANQLPKAENFNKENFVIFVSWIFVFCLLYFEMQVFLVFLRLLKGFSENIFLKFSESV